MLINRMLTDKDGRIRGNKEIHHHRIGVTRQGNEILSDRAVRPGEPGFTVLSLAPVQPITVLMARCVDPSSPFSAAATACSNSASTPEPNVPRCNSLPLFGRFLGGSPAGVMRRDKSKSTSDKGKSGLSIDGRDALKRLIADVEAGRANFETILVYDVSRWGRFQDADEERILRAHLQASPHHGPLLRRAV